jgi:3-hydroxybutyryl-CoA dehydratase
MTAISEAPRTVQGRKITPQQAFSLPFSGLSVGDHFETHGRTITESDVVNFSNWTGDTLPVHVDRHWAERHGLYGQRIANGLLVISYTVGLLPLDPSRVVALRRMRDVVLKRPTFLGDTIRARGEVTGLVPLGPFGCVVTCVSTVNQDDQVVVRGTFEMLWRLDGPGDAPVNGRD